MRRVFLADYGVQVGLLHRDRSCPLWDVFHDHGIQTPGLEQFVVHLVKEAVGALCCLQVNGCPSGELEDGAGDLADWFGNEAYDACGDEYNVQ